MLEPALFFSPAAISVSTNFNLLLQHEQPTVHILKASMVHLRRKIATRIIKPTALRGISSISDIDIRDDSIFIELKSTFLGGIPKATLNRLLSEGDISQHKYDSFHTSFLRMHYSTFKTNFQSKMRLITIVCGLM